MSTLIQASQPPYLVAGRPPARLAAGRLAAGAARGALVGPLAAGAPAPAPLLMAFSFHWFYLGPPRLLRLVDVHCLL